MSTVSLSDRIGLLRDAMMSQSLETVEMAVVGLLDLGVPMSQIALSAGLALSTLPDERAEMWKQKCEECGNYIAFHLNHERPIP